MSQNFHKFSFSFVLHILRVSDLHKTCQHFSVASLDKHIIQPKENMNQSQSCLLNLWIKRCFMRKRSMNAHDILPRNSIKNETNWTMFIDVMNTWVHLMHIRYQILIHWLIIGMFQGIINGFTIFDMSNYKSLSEQDENDN